MNEERHIQAVLTADDPLLAAIAYDSLFKKVGREGLGRLRSHTSDTIAIQAAWEEVEWTLPVEAKEPFSPDRVKLAWFLGFLEGRGRLTIPKWYSEEILGAFAHRRGNLVPQGFFNRGPWKKPKLLPPVQGRIEIQVGKPVLQSGANTVHLPADIHKHLNQKMTPSTDVRVLLTPQRCYLAAPDGIGSKYRLACLERATGKLQWLTDVWASFWGGGPGPSQHWLEISEQGDRVVVFGIALGFYVEAFRLKDGANQFRLCNNYTPWPREE